MINIQLNELSDRKIFGQNKMTKQDSLRLDYLANGMYLCKVLIQNPFQTQFVTEVSIEQWYHENNRDHLVHVLISKQLCAKSVD